VLLRAAAIGREFDSDLLAESSGSPPARVRAALRAACALQLIEPADGVRGRFRFRHALTRDAVYGELIASRLRPLHREIASALERLASRRGTGLEELAYHWWAAGDPDRGAFYNEAAGDRAAAVHALDEALCAYRRAIDVLPPRSAVRKRLQRKIGALATPNSNASP
jgi:predicted ATPase